MGPIQSFEDFAGMLRRHLSMIVLVALIGSALAAWYGKTRPKIYESAAVIQVEMPTVADTAQGDPQITAQQVMQNIQQRLTTRDNIIAIIDRHGLFADAPGLSLEDKVAAMRGSIRFQSVTSATGSGLSAILVVAQSETAENAARVANDLAQSVLDLGVEGKLAAADASSTFFKEEEARLWQSITALEAEIAKYREEHRAALPSTRDARQDEIALVNTALRDLDQQSAALQSELTRLQAIKSERATDRRRAEDVAAQIDVVAAQRAPLLERKTKLEADMGDSAEVDRALSTYDRQMRQMQDQYTVVSQRLAEAQTNQRLAERQQTGRFSLLERAITPEYPTRSGGKKMAIAGAIGSLGLGLVLAFLLDLARPVIRNSAQLERELNLRPIVAIPTVAQNSRLKKGRKAIASLIESELGRLPSFGAPRDAVMLGCALVMLMVAVASMA
jgi:tyrosine-protein kinase Etk/Wzc